MGILWVVGFIILAIRFFRLFFSKIGPVDLLHEMYEIGSTAEKRYEIASKMFRLAISKKDEQSRLNDLHKTLDVILCEGKFNTIQSGTEFHKNYWELGHRTAIEIKKSQENLNIDSFWFADDYDSAMKLKKRK